MKRLPILLVMVIVSATPALTPCPACEPHTLGVDRDKDRASFSFYYSGEQRRLKTESDNVQREAVEGGAWLHVTRSVSLWARARGSGPWGDDRSSWSLTDLEFGPHVYSGRRWGRADIEGWLTMAAPAGTAPEDDIWYKGIRAWSLGIGARAAARVLGRSGSTPLWGVFGFSYRGSGRSGWTYLPHHSVAMADTANELSGKVFTWQAGLEFRGERATLSTGFLWEEPLGAGEIMVTKERPIYLIQRAGVRAWRRVSLMVSGEILLSGDDPETSFKTVSLVPRWSAGVGVTWGYPL